METTHLIKDLIHDNLAKSTTTPRSEATTSPELSGWKPTFNAYEESLRDASEMARKLVEDMERGVDPYWLTLSGTAGCGKTLLARQIFEQAKRINPGNPANNPIWPPDWQTNGEHRYAGRRPYCLYFDERDLAARMRAGEYDLVNELRDDYLVVIDELGVTRDPSNFVASCIAELGQKRLGRWTIWATNFTMSEIAQRIDERIASRLVRDGNVLVQIKAGDYALHT